MLDAKTLEWLERREDRYSETGYYISPWDFSGKSLYGMTERPNWKDCAEFEARLNKHLIEGEEIDVPCSHVPKPFGCPYSGTWNTPCEWCNLKELRLLVEKEME